MLRILFLMFVLSMIATWLPAQPGSDPEEEAQAEADAEADFSPSLSNPIENQQWMRDRLVFLDTNEAWVSGQMEGVEVSASDADSIVMVMPERPRFPARGRWISPEIETDFPATEFIPSWNALTPPDTGVTFDVRVRMAATGEWSPWLYMGQWGRTLQSPYRRISFDKGEVHVDILQLTEPANAFQIRASLLSWDLNREAKASLQRLAMVYSGPPGPLDGPAVEADAGPAERWARDLGVPFRAQRWEDPAIGGSICSPTSVSMVMEHWGVSRPTLENAMAIYDPDYGIFGNWVRGTQRAGELGLDAWVDRFRSWEKVKETIATGQPIIASIKFREGTFPSNVMNSTSGHLIVIRGMTPEGDLIINDPASPDRGNGIVYKADELAQAWFDVGGVGYIIRPRGEKKLEANGQ
jgi:hypothetical protein